MTDQPGAGRLLSGRYRLIETVGSGGMAVVWQAFDTVLGRRVAVKILSEESTGDATIVGRLHNEARAVAQLTHPNVAQVYDYGLEAVPGQAPRAFVVMELVDGHSLRSLIAGGAALPWREATVIVKQVATALAAAHQRGIVHRDVSPGNIMIGRDGVKVVDFGIAALLGEPDSPADPPNALLGTPAYVAPERLMNPTSPVTPAVDIYALGVLWYRLVMGQLPWSATSREELLAAHVSQQPLPLVGAPDLPPDVVELCVRCLAKDPALRPSAAEIQHTAHALDLTVAPPSLPITDGQPAATERVTELLSWVTQVQSGRTEPAGTGDTDARRHPAQRSPARRRLAFAAASALSGLALVMAYLLYGWSADPIGTGADSVLPSGPTVTTSPAELDPVGTQSATPTASAVPGTGLPSASAPPLAGPVLSPITTTPPSGTAVPGVGGTAWFTCVSKDTVQVVGFAPNPGYLLVELHAGPAKDVKAVFAAGPRRTEIRATCQASVVRGHVDER